MWGRELGRMFRMRDQVSLESTGSVAHFYPSPGSLVPWLRGFENCLCWVRAQLLCAAPAWEHFLQSSLGITGLPRGILPRILPRILPELCLSRKTGVSLNKSQPGLRGVSTATQTKRHQSLVHSHLEQVKPSAPFWCWGLRKPRSAP